MVNLKGFGSSLYQCALGCSTPVYQHDKLITSVYVAVRKSLAKPRRQVQQLMRRHYQYAQTSIQELDFKLVLDFLFVSERAVLAQVARI